MIPTKNRIIFSGVWRYIQSTSLSMTVMTKTYQNIMAEFHVNMPRKTNMTIQLGNHYDLVISFNHMRVLMDIQGAFKGLQHWSLHIFFTTSSTRFSSSVWPNNKKLGNHLDHHFPHLFKMKIIFQKQNTTSIDTQIRFNRIEYNRIG